MKKVQFFEDDGLDRLQQKVNTWLSDNKEAEVNETGMSQLKEKVVFYILYSVISGEAMEIAAVAENVIVNATIKPETLSPGN